MKNLFNFSFDFTIIIDGKLFILNLLTSISSLLITTPKNNLNSKFIEKPFKLVGIPVLSVNRRTLGTA